MDADKVSRSGRKVKTPFKFHDMEVVDPITGRRTITNSPLPLIPKVRAPITGKRRGRPPRNPLQSSGSSHIPQNGLIPDESMQYLMDEDDQQSLSDENSMEASSLPSENTSLTTATHSQDAPSSRIFHLQSTAENGSPVHQSVAVQFKYAQPIASAVPSAVSPKRERAQSPVKQVKRRRPVPMKHYDGHVDIPDGLLEAMRKKRQVTAYLVFCRAERPAVMRDFPDGDFTQFSKELGNRWTALDEDKKTYWRRIALRIAQTLTDERETGFTPERARKARDKLVRELEARVNDPPSNTAFDLVANMNIVGEQFTNMANCINFLSFTPGSQEPTGCLDALMDSALVVISSTLGLMAQVPILRDSLDTEIFDDLADNNGMIMPLVHSK